MKKSMLLTKFPKGYMIARGGYLATLTKQEEGWILEREDGFVTNVTLLPQGDIDWENLINIVFQ